MLRDHPEIEWIEITGYPSFAQPDDYYCSNCGTYIDGVVYEDNENEYLCEYCLLKLHDKFRL